MNEEDRAVKILVLTLTGRDIKARTLLNFYYKEFINGKLDFNGFLDRILAV